MILIISKAIFLLIWLHTISLCFVWKKTLLCSEYFIFKSKYNMSHIAFLNYTYLQIMVQQFDMFNWFLITLSFMLKADVKCSFTITIIFCYCSLCWKKPFCAFLVMYPDVNLNITQNDRNVTKPRDHCSAFQNVF